MFFDVLEQLELCPLIKTTNLAWILYYSVSMYSKMPAYCILGGVEVDIVM
jgi:hypothetical protein